MSYRKNYYESNRDDDRFSKQYVRKPQKDQAEYVPKEGPKRNKDQQYAPNFEARREGMNAQPEYVPKPKKETNQHPQSNQDATAKEGNEAQPAYVPKKGPRKSREETNIALDNNVGNREENTHKNYVPKKVPKNPSDQNAPAPEGKQDQFHKGKKEGHHDQKDHRKPKKPKNDSHNQAGNETKGHGQAYVNSTQDPHQENANKNESRILRNTSAKQENNDKGERKHIYEKDPFEYDQDFIAEITASIHEAALDIPEQVIENPKPANQPEKVQEETNQQKQVAPAEEQKIEKDQVHEKVELKKNQAETKKEKPKKEQPEKKQRIKELNWISDEFHKVYRGKRNFLELYRRLEKLWDEVYLTLEDEDATYQCFLQIKPNFIHSYSMFIVLLFHLLVEKHLYQAAVDLSYQQTNMIEKENLFGPIIFDAAKDAEERVGRRRPNGNSKAMKKVTDTANLTDLGRKREDVNVLERFDKSGKRFIKVGALEKIKKEDQIAVHFERNEHRREYLSVIQIATRNEVFILDLERLCKFEDNTLALAEFFSIIFAKRSTVIIVMNAKELCQGIIDSLFLDKETENKEFVEKKRELCQVFERYEGHFTDLSKLGVGTNVSELFQNVLKMKLDLRQRFGDWYRRPLTEDQVLTTAIEVCGLYACYDRLFEENLGAEAQN